ncbi:hypothetical protein ABMA28_012769 [Loxostege sticticalis]|uniref:TIR domain-containing protein n=1 Tax=Loxostege sticticalis TaxID=481309 RepID=A0ABD0S4Z6_LOXSC
MIPIRKHLTKCKPSGLSCAVYLFPLLIWSKKRQKNHICDQSRIPFDALDALSTLKSFRIDGAHLTLEASGGDDITPHLQISTIIILNSGVKDVPPGAFIRFPNISLLKLSDNEIVNLTEKSFKGLKNLMGLNLSGNPITALPSHVFDSLMRLRFVFFDRTHLNSVLEDTFQGQRSLRMIDFTNGKDAIKFESRALANMPELTHLTIKSTTLKPLLRMLTISDAGLTFFPKDLLETQKNLEELDLSGNKITVLEKSFFRFVRALQVLNLDRNRIKEIPDNIFFGLRKLEKVSASGNGLQYIAPNAFVATNYITHLSLHNNLLTSEVLSSVRLNNLKELGLSSNRISYMVPHWKLIYHLVELDLSRNNFTALEQADLMFRSPRIIINLQDCHITSIKFNYIPSMLIMYTTRVLLDHNPLRCDCKLYMFILASQYRLKSHSIAMSEISLEHATCASPPTLAGKFIQDVPLTSLTCSLAPQECPANCTCDLRPETHSLELDCETEPSTYPSPDNHGQKTTTLRLRNLKSQPLILPSHVISLNLAGLGLTEPPLLKTHKIQKLDLTRNQLTDAPLELLKENITLRLSGNEFICDCSHLDHVFALQSNAARIDDAENVTCKGGEYLMHIKAEKLCEIRKETVIGATLAVLGGLVAIVSGLANRYSLQIKVFLFSRGWCQSWVHEADIDHAEYDAFVSFSQDDAQWVAEQLLPNLEGEPNNYKLCVHYRDWVVGDMIPAQIATSVEQSRRTIIVLTKNFLKSTWAPLEFRAANAHAQRERRARVLVVVLGEIPDCEEMDAELRAYLSTNTYLKWGDPWFWEKLKYAMPHRRQNVG